MKKVLKGKVYWKGGLEQIHAIQMKTGGRELERRSNYVYNGLKGKWISWE